MTSRSVIALHCVRASLVTKCAVPGCLLAHTYKYTRRHSKGQEIHWNHCNNQINADIYNNACLR